MKELLHFGKPLKVQPILEVQVAFVMAGQRSLSITTIYLVCDARIRRKCSVSKLKKQNILLGVVASIALILAIFGVVVAMLSDSILEYDTYGPNDEINYFYSQYKNFPVTIKEPDEEVITSWQHPGFLYVQDYVNTLEKALNDKEPWEVIENLIDIDSYIDWWLVHELAGNTEPIWPKSSYMYKKRDEMQNP